MKGSLAKLNYDFLLLRHEVNLNSNRGNFLLSVQQRIIDVSARDVPVEDTQLPAHC